MKNVDVASIRITVHAHSTERPDAVVDALLNLVGLSSDDLGEGALDPVKVEGDFSNVIRIYTLNLRKKSHTRRFMQHLGQLLPEDHKWFLDDNFSDFYSPGRVIFLRFHKQALYDGEFRLSLYDDVVHVAIRLAIYKKQGPGQEIALARGLFRDFGVIPAGPRPS